MTLSPCSSALLTDLYELTMLQAYWREGMNGVAVFELFIRRLPRGRNFLMAAGLAQVLDYLENLAFSSEELNWLSSCGLFAKDFVDYLAPMRFRGDVHALPEGTVFFADEPLLRITAPLPQAQFIETRLLNIMNFSTAAASKAARCVLAAGDRRLVEFGLRRAQGGEGGLWASRAAYLAGFDATSNTLAAPLFGIPVSGTMAHSFIQAHDSEAEAFEIFARANPQSSTLLLDTYDVDAAAAQAAILGVRLGAEGLPLQGVRLDSGDMAAQAKRVRRELDVAGLESATIFASGNLDEWAIRDLLSAGAPIGGFGVGTRLSTSADAPYFDCAYKLQEYAGKPRRKRSEGKATWPGRKQVWRSLVDDWFAGDVVALEGEPFPGAPLLVPVMREGRRLVQPSLEESRRYARVQLEALPRALRSLDPAPPYSVRLSEGLRALAAALDEGRRPVSAAAS
jgi:nicotinate phosphoribosyltransferase